jgi:hypothetical protein
MQLFSDFLVEASRANKFNIHWQIVRTQARDIKDPDAKIKHVMNHLNSNKNIHNFGRVHNWLKMTGVAYKGDDRSKFEHAVSGLEKRKSEFSSPEDNENDLSKVSREDLQKVHKDLLKRKYGFQYKTVPKAHTDFMDQLKTELDKRK